MALHFFLRVPAQPVCAPYIYRRGGLRLFIRYSAYNMMLICRWMLCIFLMNIVPMIGRAQQSDTYIDSLIELRSPYAQARLQQPFGSFRASNGEQRISNKKLLGKVVFVNFWFEQCAPCIQEFPALNQLYQSIKDSSHMAFVSFTFETPDAIERIKEKYGLRYPIFSLSKEDCARLLIKPGYPTNLLLNKQGRIALYKTGGALIDADIRRFLLVFVRNRMNTLALAP